MADDTTENRATDGDDQEMVDMGELGRLNVELINDTEYSAFVTSPPDEGGKFPVQIRFAMLDTRIVTSQEQIAQFEQFVKAVATEYFDKMAAVLGGEITYHETREAREADKKGVN